MNDLRTSLHRVADAVEPLPVGDDLWQRGVTARRRGRALVVAAVLAIIVSVSWSAVLLGNDDREARTASTEVVEGGAIPSPIEDIPDDLDVDHGPRGRARLRRPSSPAAASRSSSPPPTACRTGSTCRAGWPTAPTRATSG